MPSSSTRKSTGSTPSSSTDASGKEKLVQYSELAMRTNVGILEYRTCQSAAAGMAAGILGLTGIQGFVFYFLSTLLQAVIWELKAGFDWRSFFLERTLSFTHSMVGGLFTYILFWVFLYGMVHVY